MLRENEQLELKKTTKELNDAMMSISGILNKHRKGQLYFGVKNDGSPFRFDIGEATVRDVSRKIYEAIRPQIFPIVEIEEIDGIEVIRVDFEGNDIPYSAFGKYYIRTADEDREMPPSELRKLMINKEYEDNWEDITTEETLDDVEDFALEKFFDLAVSCGRLPKMEYEKEALLNKLQLMRRGKLTNAGRVLFSKNRPITLKMAVFATEHKDTFLDIKRIDGNIFKLIDEAMQYAIKNIRWHVNLGEDGIHREEIPEIPVPALREAIINSFAHARYDIPVQHEIGIYSNRIVITNPGAFANSYRPIDFLKQDIHSFLRNENISRVLYLCRDVETFGSGLRKIYSMCEQQGTSVSYKDTDTYFSIEFSRIDKNITPNCAINGIINGTINEEMQTILNLIMQKPSITTTELSKAIGKSTRTISRILASLREKNLIERVGSNKTGYWKTL